MGEDTLLTGAVRKLRQALNDTQQEFANRLGMAISTVVRYEHNRPPSGKALAKLEQVAVENGLKEYADVFRRALQNELGAAAPDARSPRTGFKNEEEEQLVEALLASLRDPQFTAQAKAVKRQLKPILEELRRRREQKEALEASSGAIVWLLRDGRGFQEVATMFKTEIEDVIDVLYRHGDRQVLEKRGDEAVTLLLKKHHSVGEIADRLHLPADDVVEIALENNLASAASEYLDAHRREGEERS